MKVQQAEYRPRRQMKRRPVRLTPLVMQKCAAKDCKNVFPKTRKDRKFCSPRCRMVQWIKDQ